MSGQRRFRSHSTMKRIIMPVRAVAVVTLGRYRPLGTLNRSGVRPVRAPRRVNTTLVHNADCLSTTASQIGFLHKEESGSRRLYKLQLSSFHSLVVVLVPNQWADRVFRGAGVPCVMLRRSHATRRGHIDCVRLVFDA